MLIRVVLPTFQVCEPPGLTVNIPDLLVGLHIEVTDPATGWCAKCFLKIRVETTQSTCGRVGDLVALVNAPGAIGGMVLPVKVVQDRVKAGRKPVLLVQSNGLLDRLIADDVAMCQILSNDPGAWLVLLLNFVTIFILGVGRCRGMRASNVVDRLSGLDTDRRGAELSVIQEPSSLRGAMSGDTLVRLGPSTQL